MIAFPIRLTASTNASPARGRITASPRPAILLGLATCVLSLIWFAWYFHHDLLLSYADAVTHPMIARRVLDSPTPGISQIGGVWPPLPHLLVLPLIWNDWLYYSGVAASFLSMACYVITVVTIYRIGRRLHLIPIIALVPSVIVAFNPNIRYMQSVGMTELPLIATEVVAVYFLIRWSQTESLRSFMMMMVAIVAATATRYEGWILWMAILVAVVYVMLRRRWNRAKIIDYVGYYLVFSGIFIPVWMSWNEIVLHTGWMGFSTGKYASSTIWVTASEPSIGHLDIAFKTYWYAMVGMCGIRTLTAGLVGLLVFLLRDRLRLETASILVLAFPVPFFVAALYTGQRPLHVAEISGDLYNVRFALQMLPLFSLLIGIALQAVVDGGHWFVGRFELRVSRSAAGLLKWVGILLLALGVAFTSSIANIALREPSLAVSMGGYRMNQIALADCVKHATASNHVRLLMETPGNEMVLFYSEIDMAGVVYEGSYQVWNAALIQPVAYVDWIYMRTTPGDEDAVWDALHNNPAALASFRPVVVATDVILYGRTSLVGKGSPTTCVLPSSAPAASSMAPTGTPST